MPRVSLGLGLEVLVQEISGGLIGSGHFPPRRAFGRLYFLRVYRHAVKSGLIARYSAESVS